MEQSFFTGADVWHHSRFLTDRRPYGAVPLGTRVTLVLHISKELAALHDVTAALRLWSDGGEKLIPGTLTETEASACFTFEAEMPGHPGLVWYYFILTRNGKKRYYGGTSGLGELYDDAPPAYQITVYDGAFTVPEWFRRGILYQIFPDRFRRGEKGKGLENVAYHQALGRDAVPVPDWNSEVLYTPLFGHRDYSPCDYFGGTLAGIEEALPYLKSLGVTCLYLNPVFEAASNHRYNTADYHKIDPVLGTEEDLASLCRAAEKEGIRVMLDGVFSHTGDDSVYFDRYARYGQSGAYQSRGSPYYHWYSFSHWPNEYKSWWGFQTLPEVNELAQDYRAFLFGENGVLSHWHRTGVSSWRLDVADELPDEFLREFRSVQKALNPDGVLLGEVWEDATNKISMGGRRGYSNGDELDSVMNYPFAEAVAAFLTEREDAYELLERLSLLREHYPKPMYYALMNLLDSHDSVRALYRYCGAPPRDALPREEQARVRFSGEGLALGKARLRLAALLQMVMPGVPSLYYGDEAGLGGMADPFNRGPYPWGREDEELLAWYRLITRVRSTSDAMKSGLAAFSALSPNVFAVAREVQNGLDAFSRPAESGTVIALLNRSGEQLPVSFSEKSFSEGPDKVIFPDALRDAVSGVRVVKQSGEFRLLLPPLGGVLLKS